MISRAYERRRMELISRRVSGGRVLDVGYAQQPNDFVRASHVTGLDLVRPDRPPHGYDELLVGDASDPAPLVDGRRFDAVVAGEFIEHLDDPLGFLRRAKEVIAPGGSLILSTPNPVSFPVFAAELMLSRRWFFTEDHTFYFPPRWMWRLLERAGYDLVATEAVGLWLPFGYIPWCPVGASYQVVYEARPLR